VLDYLKAKWPEVTFTSIESKAWGSQSFTGAKHVVTCQMPNDSNFLEEVLDHEYAVPHQLVADVVITHTGTDVVGNHTDATLEILTLED
jgi:hypothetical protein